MDKPTCQLCGSVFAQLKNLYKHINKVHKLKVITGSCTCPINPCVFKFTTRKLLREHLLRAHRIQNVEEKEEHQLDSFTDFLQWKKRMENETKSSFTSGASHTLADGCRKKYYICNRSGVYKSQATGWRRPKIQGSLRSGKCCPALLEVTEKEKLHVTFYKTHVGHDNELEKSAQGTSEGNQSVKTYRTKQKVTCDDADGRVTCDECGKHYKNKKQLAKHKYNYHKNRFEGSITCSVEGCSGLFLSLEHYRKHLMTVHSIEFEEKAILHFNDNEEFIAWLAVEERAKSAHFTLHRGVTKFTDHTSRIYYCNRSGSFRSKGFGIRRPRSKGSCKLGYYCTAEIRIRQYEDHVEAEYYQDHFGHEAESVHLPNPREDNDDIPVESWDSGSTKLSRGTYIGIKKKKISPDDECMPISSFESLKTWKPTIPNHTTVPLTKRESVRGQPQTLVCHDMKGGYLDDRLINGSNNTENNFYFLHWTAIDIFVYFSHNLVTIPPCGWISAAHKNGVKILGTFITEWDDGIKVCDALLENEDTVEEISTQLVKIANHFNFDGWLINIENKIQPHHILLLEQFLKILSHKMHLNQPESLVIWYDSVLENGDLKWQNGLNENNRLFFDCCDGIFLNYNWTEETLNKSVEMANERKTDVFVGADVFGRGCPGGGGFSTNVAVSAARQFGLSVAIFAPGWIYECLEIKDFKENQFRFWNALQEFCPPRKLNMIPFYSSFCPGFGKKLYKNGKILSNIQWFNVSLQQIQPIYFSDLYPENCEMSLCMEDSFQGGGCISLTLNEERTDTISVFKILETSFLIEDSLVVSYTFKKSSTYVGVNLKLSMSDDSEEKYEQYLCSEPHILANPSSSYILPSSSDDISLLSHYEVDKNPTQIEGWIKRSYILKMYEFSDHIIEGISVQVSAPLNEKCTILLGELEILPFHPPKVRLQYRDLVCKFNEVSGIISIECTLFWTQHPSIQSSDLFLVTKKKRKHICRTSQFYYCLEFSAKQATELEVLLSFSSRGTDHIPDTTLKIPIEVMNDQTLNLDI